jgi:hypothetical protein
VIQTRTTQCGSTISAYGSSGAPQSAGTINTAITACTAGQFVLLGTGHFYLNTAIVFNGKANVTLRGGGPNTTFLHWQGSGSGGDAGGNAINVTPVTLNYNDGPHNVCTWSAGYTRGTTVLTVGSCSVGATSSLTVGTGLFLDQLSDSTTDNGEFWVAGGDASFVAISCSSCARNVARTLRGQVFYTTVTAINGSAITIADPLLHPNWASGKTPQMWFAGSGAAQADIVGVGIENLSVDLTNLNITGSNGHQFGVYFGNADQSWIKNTRFIALAPTMGGADDIRAQLRIYQSSHITVRDNYFYGKQGASGNYGWETFGGSNNLIENNIGECNSTPVTDNTAGTVFGYNYILNDCYVNQNWMQPAHYFHSAGNSFVLIEGNDTPGVILDIIHGSAHFITGYRNRWHGWEHGKTTQTVAVHNYGYSRFTNIVGNVLGQSGFHTTYETAAGGSTTNCALSIFALGLGANCADGGTGGNPPNDTLVKTTMLRWGNYDTVNAVNRWENGEVPSGLAQYANPIPPNQNLPASLYLSAQPSWWSAKPYPAIGPDVTGATDEASVGGHVNNIPAKDCFLSLSMDTAYAVSKTVTAGSYAGGLATLTIGAHSFLAGDAMRVTGVSPSAYDGDVLIYSVTGTTVSYGLLANPGAYTSGGTAYSPSVRQFSGCSYQ